MYFRVDEGWYNIYPTRTTCVGLPSKCHHVHVLWLKGPLTWYRVHLHGGCPDNADTESTVERTSPPALRDESFLSGRSRILHSYSGCTRHGLEEGESAVVTLNKSDVIKPMHTDSS